MKTPSLKEIIETYGTPESRFIIVINGKYIVSSIEPHNQPDFYHVLYESVCEGEDADAPRFLNLDNATLLHCGMLVTDTADCIAIYRRHDIPHRA